MFGADDIEVISVASVSAPRVRDVQELDEKIRQSGGRLTVNNNASEYIVAINNLSRYSVVPLSDGSYQITLGAFSDVAAYLPYLLLGAGVLLALSLIKR